MYEMNVEIPYALMKMKKVRANYGPDGEIGIIGLGSYECDLNGGRTVTGPQMFDGDYLKVRNGKKLSELRVIDSGVSRFKSHEIAKNGAIRLNKKGVPFIATMTTTFPRRNDDTEEAFEFLDLLADGLEGNGVVVANQKVDAALRNRYGKSLT